MHIYLFQVKKLFQEWKSERALKEDERGSVGTLVAVWEAELRLQNH